MHFKLLTMLIKHVDIILITKSNFYLEFMCFLYVWGTDDLKAFGEVPNNVRRTDTEMFIKIKFLLVRSLNICI